MNQAMKVDGLAGDMLYLPAGWFHEVTSYSSSSSHDPSWHMALNYWFHPPDNLVPSGFSKPYLTDYWKVQSGADFNHH